MQVETVIDADIVKFVPEFNYIHLRYHDEDGTIRNLGGVTIAYKTDVESVRYGVACCSEADNFDKAYGRQAASECVRSGRGKEIYIPANRSAREIVRDYVIPLVYERILDIRRRRTKKESAATQYKPVLSRLLIDVLY